MRVLITGGAGFIGSNLVREMLGRGHDVVVLDDLSTGFADNLEGLDVELVRAGLLDEEQVSRAISGAESVVHLAALGSVPRSIGAPLASHRANATGTLMLLEAARAHGVGHVVTASSSSVYGLNPTLPKSEREWVRPISPYAVTKLAAEQYTLAYQQSYGMRTLAFRFFNVYGPRQRAGHVYAAVVPVFVDAMLGGRPLPVHGDGEQSRDFTYVGTVCEVLRRAVEDALTAPEPVNLAFGARATLNTVIGQLEQIVGHPAAIDRQPPRNGDVRHSLADNGSLRRLVPDVRPTELAHGLRETVEWFRTVT